MLRSPSPSVEGHTSSVTSGASAVSPVEVCMHLTFLLLFQFRFIIG